MSSDMRLVYTPEGGSKRSWTIDLENPAWDITFTTEKVTGWTWFEFSTKLSTNSVIALRALLWVLRKRDEPKLQLESVEVLFSEVKLEDPDDDETDDEGPTAEADAEDPKED